MVRSSVRSHFTVCLEKMPLRGEFHKHLILFRIHFIHAVCVPSSRFLVGGPGTGSHLHVDPVATSAWNALVEGTKRWVLIESAPPSGCGSGNVGGLMGSSSPPVQPNQTQSVEEYFAECVPRLIASAFPLPLPAADAPPTAHALRDSATSTLRRLLVFDQSAGETVYVPAGWQHAVLNTTFTAAITHNFVPRAHRDAFAAALASHAARGPAMTSSD